MSFMEPGNEEHRSESSPPSSRGPRSARQRREEAAADLDPALLQSVETLIPSSYVSPITQREESYNPFLIAKGGEHLVFEFEDVRHHDVVYKINFARSLPVLEAMLRGPVQKKHALTAMKEEMEEQASRLRELRGYFGFDAIPVQRMMIREVPISRDIAEQLLPRLKRVRSLPEKVPAWIVVQRRLDLPPDQVLEMRGYYAEHPSLKERLGDDFDDIYDTAHAILIGEDSELPQEAGSIPPETYVLDLFPDLYPLARQAHEDPIFRKKLQQTVHQLIRYTQETATCLDLAGRHNFVLNQGEGKEWVLKILDPLFGADPVTLHDLGQAISALGSRQHMSPVTLGLAMNALNTVRVINALALFAGVPERLQVPGLERVPAHVWRDKMAQLFVQ